VEPVTRWLVVRGLQALLTFALVAVLLFFLMRLAPGDPLSRLSGEQQISPREIEHLRAQYGLDQPVWRQFVTWVASVGRGDLGDSIEYGRPVTSLIAERLPATMLLGGTVLLINFSLGLWLGVVQAVRRGTPLDRWLTAASLAGYALPSFWLGLVLAWLMAVLLRLLPAGGLQNPLLSPDAPMWVRGLDVAAHLVLPATTLVIVSIASTMRYQRRAMLEVLPLPYIVAARAKGLPERLVLRRHAWRNALFPVLTLAGLWLPILATGSVFVESVFAWPGLGSLAAGAVGTRDYPLLMGTALLVSALIVLGGLLADIAYGLLDPRIRWT
jgi:peptide/nickel transport system permease protein